MKLSMTLFKSKNCPLCRQMEPVFDAVSSELKGKVETKKSDIIENPQEAVENGVMSIPTIIIFRDGEEAERFAGSASAEKIASALKQNGL